MKLSQQVLVPDEQVDLTRKVMDRIPDPTFVSCSLSLTLQQSSLTKHRGCRETLREVMEEKGRSD